MTASSRPVLKHYVIHSGVSTSNQSSASWQKVNKNIDILFISMSKMRKSCAFIIIFQASQICILVIFFYFLSGGVKWVDVVQKKNNLSPDIHIMNN